MKVAFRIDISSEIGTGHLTRMSALADAFSELNYQCVFFKGEDEPIDYSPFDIIVLDTYKISNEYIASLNMQGRLLVCYDDNALYKYDCDVILNANLHAHELDFRFGEKKPLLLLGGKYSLLRREFRDSSPLEIRERANKVFVCFGGSDIRNMTPKIIRTLQEIDDIYISVVLGAYTKNDDEVFALSNDSITVTKTPASISEIMKSCDIAVTASGSMVYELAAIGMPCVAVVQADNQIIAADYLSKNDIIVNIGSWDYLNHSRFQQEVSSLLLDYSRRNDMSAKMLKLVDKNGAMNAARGILALTRR